MGLSVGRVEVWDLALPGKRGEVRVPGGPVYALAFSPDGRYLASGGQDREVRLYDLEAGLLERVYVGHTGAVYGLDFNPQTPALATGGGEGRVLLFRLP